jgi:hypothetical protein
MGCSDLQIETMLRGINEWMLEEYAPVIRDIR